MASTEGVLLYEGHRSDGTGDFIALTLAGAHILFTIDLGSGALTLRWGERRLKGEEKEGVRGLVWEGGKHLDNE